MRKRRVTTWLIAGCFTVGCGAAWAAEPPEGDGCREVEVGRGMWVTRCPGDAERTAEVLRRMEANQSAAKQAAALAWFYEHRTSRSARSRLGARDGDDGPAAGGGAGEPQRGAGKRRGRAEPGQAPKLDATGMPALEGLIGGVDDGTAPVEPESPR